MRRLRFRPRQIHFVVFGFALLLAAWKGVQHYKRRATSPFAVWDFRPGVSFASLDRLAYRKTGQHFRCYWMFREIELCQMRVGGIPGIVRAIVDRRGRVVRVQFLPKGASPAMREEGRRLAATWNRTSDPVVDPRDKHDAERSTTRWYSADHKWSAVMRYGRFGTTPYALELTERARFRELLALAPLAGLVLRLNELADSSDVGDLGDLTSVLRSVQSRRAMAMADRRPVPRVSTTHRRCEPVVPDLGVSPPGLIADTVTRTLLAEAFARSSGLQVVYGDEMWLVDSTGQRERVFVGAHDVAEWERMTVFAVHFPARLARATDRLREKRPENFCGAPAELLLVERAPDGSLAGVQRVVIDVESVASDIDELSLIPPNVAGDPPEVRARYTALHAATGWVASLQWEAVVVGNPPRVTARSLLGVGDKGEADQEPGAGPIVVTRRAATELELSTVERYDWGFATHSMTVPLDSSGALRGGAILERLFQARMPNN